MRWLMVLLTAAVGLGGLGTTLSLGGTVAAQLTDREAATATPFPLYLPYLGRASGGTPAPRPTPTLPPPILADPYPGTICPVQGGAYICWPSARYTLSRGPGEACGSGMTPAFYLVSDSVNLELYQGRPVLVRGERVDSPNCVPLLRVTNLEVPTPTP